ncbi:DUF1007 family protein [Providencia manganoxydans]|nr:MULTISPECIES: DUF1007 family protein [Providencia]MDW7588079.1 DUF1007 family protein [Providencia sp. 2023EL-00965]
MMMKFNILFLFFSLIFTTKSFAHPHSFIDMQVTPEIKEHQFVGLAFTWKMDPMTSADIAYELKNSKEDEPKWRAQAAAIMANILAQNYFTDFYSQGKKIAFQTLPSNYRLQRDGLQLIFSFTAQLKHPIPVAGANIEFMTYDPTFFVSMTYPDQKALHSAKAPQTQCKITLHEPDVTDELRFYAYSLDIDQSPEEDETLGLQFAQKVKIQCQ